MKHKAKAMECQKGQTPKRVDGSNSEITPKEALITPRALTGLLGKITPVKDELTDKNYKIICEEIQYQDGYSTDPTNGLINTRGTTD